METVGYFDFKFRLEDRKRVFLEYLEADGWEAVDLVGSSRGLDRSWVTDQVAQMVKRMDRGRILQLLERV